MILFSRRVNEYPEEKSEGAALILEYIKDEMAPNFPSRGEYIKIGQARINPVAHLGLDRFKM